MRNASVWNESLITTIFFHKKKTFLDDADNCDYACLIREFYLLLIYEFKIVIYKWKVTLKSPCIIGHPCIREVNMIWIVSGVFYGMNINFKGSPNSIIQ